MSGYNKFQVEAQHNHTTFKVLVGGWFGIWKSGYVNTNYFKPYYDTEKEALEAIARYKKRFTSA